LETDESQRVWLSKLSIPVISLDQDFGWGALRFDLRKAGFDAASILVAKGCRNIKFLSVFLHEWNLPDLPTYTARIIRAGMANALSPHGLPAPTALSREDLPQILRGGVSLSTSRVGYELFKHAMSNQHPDGIVVFTDVFAIGVARAISELGLLVGEDIQVVMLTNKELLWPELEKFTRLELTIMEVAQGLVELSTAAETNSPPREILVDYRTNVPEDMNPPKTALAASKKRRSL